MLKANNHLFFENINNYIFFGGGGGNWKSLISTNSFLVEHAYIPCHSIWMSLVGERDQTVEMEAA